MKAAVLVVVALAAVFIASVLHASRFSYPLVAATIANSSPADAKLLKATPTVIRGSTYLLEVSSHRQSKTTKKQFMSWAPAVQRAVDCWALRGAWTRRPGLQPLEAALIPHVAYR
jgi:Trk-type K+ transport system membrane component